MTITFLTQPRCCLAQLSRTHGSRKSRTGSYISSTALKFSASMACWDGRNSTSASALSCCVQPGMKQGKPRCSVPRSVQLQPATDCYYCSGARENGTATPHQHLCGVACNPPHMFYQEYYQSRAVSVNEDSPVSLGDNVQLFLQTFLEPSL